LPVVFLVDCHVIKPESSLVLTFVPTLVLSNVWLLIVCDLVNDCLICGCFICALIFLFLFLFFGFEHCWISECTYTSCVDC